MDNKDNGIDTIKIIDNEVYLFLEDIRNRFNKYNKAIDFDQSDFQIFSPASEKFFKQKNNENYLEWKIRDYLVSRILRQLFALFGYTVYAPQEKTIIHTRYDNETFGKDYEFAFIIESQNERIGFRYYPFDEEGEKVLKIIKENDINKVIIIDFSINQIYSVGRNAFLGIVDYYSLERVFDTFLSGECYSLYMSKVQRAVKIANSELGFITATNLNNRNISTYKLDLANRLLQFDIRSEKYQYFDRAGSPMEEYGELLSIEDVQIIENKCIKQKLYKSLYGSSNFAKCFITSEYMFDTLKNESSTYVDYSGVALGYFKSVELLLELLTMETLNHPHHELLSIKYKKQNNRYYTPENFVYIRRGKNSVKQIKFIEENKDGFSIEMMPLAYFIYDNVADWTISNKGREIVFKFMQNYTQGCRNEHLHKDLINNIASINIIRNNTIILLMYLLGSYKVLNDNVTYDILEIDNLEEYNRLCNELYSLPQSQYKFYIEFEKGITRKYIRLFKRSVPTFDENGDFTSNIGFIEVNDFDIEDFNEFTGVSSANIVYISKDYLPLNVWRYDYRTKGPVLIYSKA